MTYAEKLRNPKWQKKRLQVFERDDYTCTTCGDKDTELHVHHKEYSFSKEPWEYDMENFSTLCKHCHEFITFYTKNEPDDIVIKYDKYSLSNGIHFYILIYTEERSEYLLSCYVYEGINQFIFKSCVNHVFIESVTKLIDTHKKTTNGNL